MTPRQTAHLDAARADLILPRGAGIGFSFDIVIDWIYMRAIYIQYSYYFFRFHAPSRTSRGFMVVIWTDFKVDYTSCCYCIA